VQTPWTSIQRRRDEARRRRRQVYEARTGRRYYFTGTDYTDLASVRAVWYHGLETLRPSLGAAIIDLFSDHKRTHLPVAAQHAWRLLENADGGPMGMWVDLRDPDKFAAVKAFGIESIQCTAYLESDIHQGRRIADAHEVAFNHDCGWSVFLELTDAEHAELSSGLELAGIGTDEVLFAAGGV
jgi:hypothetical protein